MFSSTVYALDIHMFSSTIMLGIFIGSVLTVCLDIHMFSSTVMLGYSYVQFYYNAWIFICSVLL